MSARTYRIGQIAGALVQGLRALGAKRIALICPNMKPLTRLVVDCLNTKGVDAFVVSACVQAGAE